MISLLIFRLYSGTFTFNRYYVVGLVVAWLIVPVAYYFHLSYTGFLGVGVFYRLIFQRFSFFTSFTQTIGVPIYFSWLLLSVLKYRYLRCFYIQISSYTSKQKASDRERRRRRKRSAEYADEMEGPGGRQNSSKDNNNLKMGSFNLKARIAAHSSSSLTKSPGRKRPEQSRIRGLMKSVEEPQLNLDIGLIKSCFKNSKQVDPSIKKILSLDTS